MRFREEMAKDAAHKRRMDFYAAWEAHKRSGFPATQEAVDKLAAEYGVEAPKLAEPPKAPPPIVNDPLRGF